MASTLEQLLSPQTPEQLFALLLAVYQKYGFPTTAWQDFGVDQTRLLAISTALNTISAGYIPQIAAGGLLGYAEKLELPDWLQLLADENFDVQYNPASHTIGDILLTSTPGSGNKTIAASQLIAYFGATGNRYINNEGGTLLDGSTLSLSFTAEFTGASYNDGSNATVSLVSPIPGVTISNPAGDYTDVAHVGAGTGTLTLGGSPTAPHQVTVRIDSTGDSTEASWSYSLDGSPYVSVGVDPGPVTIGSTSITVTLVDGVSGTSFVEADTYLFNTPGSWITTQGSDLESNASLATRCRDKWAANVAAIATGSYYEYLAKSVPDVGSQVTQCIVLEDSDVNNKVNVVVSGPEGALPPATVVLIQDYITPRAIGTDYPTVQSPSTLDVTFVATVTVSAAQLVAAQAAILVAMTNYVDDLGINGTLRIAKITELVMEVTGVQDCTDVTINGAASNLTMGSEISFVVPSLQPLSFSYVTT